MSAENKFYKNYLPLSFCRWCGIFQVDMLQNHKCRKCRILWYASKAESQRENFDFWFIQKGDKWWNHIIFKFEVVENLKQFAWSVILHCIWKGTFYKRKHWENCPWLQGRHFSTEYSPESVWPSDCHLDYFKYFSVLIKLRFLFYLQIVLETLINAQITITISN